MKYILVMPFEKFLLWFGFCFFFLEMLLLI